MRLNEFIRLGRTIGAHGCAVPIQERFLQPQGNHPGQHDFGQLSAGRKIRGRARQRSPTIMS
jgi:hypothetical protein